MAGKQLAALAALIVISTPSAASDIFQQSSPGMMFYYSMPLDARNAKERSPSFGMSMRGKHDYQALTIDSRMFNSFSPLGGIEAKWIIAGVVAAGAVVAVASKDKSTSTSYQQQQQQQAAQQQAQQGGGGKTEPCPVTPVCP
jgi:hypothetical protein